MTIGKRINTPGTNDGFKLYYVEQATAAAVADNDTLTFTGIPLVNLKVLSFRSATGQVVNFDAATTTGGSAVLTVDHPDAASSKHTFGTLATGAAATSVSGLALIKGAN